MEAREWMNSRAAHALPLRDLVSADPNNRRAALKEVFYRLPARPVIKFVYYYLVRRGFLDGRAGFTYSMLQAIYEFMIHLKVNELHRRDKGLPL
jgi:hypothetical protein